MNTTKPIKNTTKTLLREETLSFIIQTIHQSDPLNFSLA
ncbi:hypothetical protein SVI_3869 [Shewanella violacea DSS12]|uniref:Uncharacterized protein n=1 Tax=Shewanella violacea (strain JCM 10179 / CIP 106290 / LMG 19151 / DSS12) TaxID=637905 RepID=D4ZCU5_SHEVD|nr:hypothetical protein SVI_3869 [Shewanella violacea DSS12]